VGFSVAENGKNVPFQVEQRAFYKGRDVSEFVRRAGVPLNIIDPGFTRTLDGLSPQKRKVLKQADLIDRESGSTAHPHWLVRTKFWWRQHFPAGKTVVLEEHYQPGHRGTLLRGREPAAANEHRHY